MNTIQAGKLFCEKYNEVNNTHHNSKKIFCDVIAPLLFYGEKHLTLWGNCKFQNASGEWFKSCKNKTYNLDLFQKVLNEFVSEIENESYGIMTTLNVFGGCAKPSLKKKGQTTMFCYSDNIYFNNEERYNSFIGSIFAFQCEGWNIIINNKELIWKTYQNILKYRTILDNNFNLNDKQIYAWNTAALFSLNENNDTSVIIDEFFKNDKLAINDKINIFNFIFKIKKIDSNINKMEFFQIGQTNTSCGIVLIDVDYVERMGRFYSQVYQEMGEDFKYADFDKIVGKKARLLYKIIENGAVYKGIFNPWDLIENKKITKYQEKIIQMVMTKEEIKLADALAKELFVIKQEKRNNIREEDFFKSKKKGQIIRYITNLEWESDIFDAFIEFTITENNEEKFNIFIAYCEYLFKQIQKKTK